MTNLLPEAKVPLKAKPVLQEPEPFVCFFIVYEAKLTELPVLLAISIALLFPDPSTYSEKRRSVVDPVPPLSVVTEMVLLEAETFPAASFAFT